ncbi:Phosphoribosylaminoimidazole-succinocarboxamide synthase [Bibersteinia trehalosi USDA-ARS-USMARC-188]|uniref:Phosphoribosylaminoimidazole-succinocarboxamide synthase n=3 Tax=Bibersteinia trehalosi TaxID=47735 RepID=W0R5G6_BIBTR|nr:phosphoribosylaminoimidazolesuccinocarboxamide synthase [Bibersteinia trehalosi]AGH38391.1 Phosphoribosylaminoimidazole-succinocarboxamide synthase [Bibersteinia trehalosi USDA-ARS-USMARC-192]AHG81810.1 Phosphoribosylaminoimidazole-succinocarboxamide synthase [Bibersteinia trehalosi USDA-ARS-USMARC-188]AHG84099.1 Phosphoribosylaminoimidazole-succinocarboxamide synthase [Bibersteinia trehalosi USDA-ARS-USMARC-189]AHG86379.1 Phosphoribosylaminoimidazole-succinocarboxamide synthase [Bibersteini
MQKLYEGKAKALYTTDNPDELLVVYSNQATAFNGEKKAQIEGKGVLNNKISSLIFQWLNAQQIPTQFVKQVDETSQIVRKLTIVPVEAIVRNRVAGSFAKRMGLEEGKTLNHPIVEFCYKDDALGDPMVNNSQLSALGIATMDELQEIEKLSLQVNEKLVELFDAIGIILVDIKFEFGKTSDGQIILGDEISPDTSRLWDKTTQAKLDKDNFRRDLGDIIPVYQEVYERLAKHISL